MENDFSNVKVDDKVFHIIYGWGTVESVADVFRVGFINGRKEYFWLNGKSDRNHLNPSVFWDEVRIIPPQKPKRKVEKIIEGWLNIYPEFMTIRGIVASSLYLYLSQKIADKEADKNRRLGEACHVIHKYTVEE